MTFWMGLMTFCVSFAYANCTFLCQLQSLIFLPIKHAATLCYIYGFMDRRGINRKMSLLSQKLKPLA